MRTGSPRSAGTTLAGFGGRDDAAARRKARLLGRSLRATPRPTRDGYGAGHCKVIKDHTRHFWYLSGTFSELTRWPKSRPTRNYNNFSILRGTVGWARTTDLLFHRQTITDGGAD